MTGFLSNLSLSSGYGKGMSSSSSSVVDDAPMNALGDKEAGVLSALEKRLTAMFEGDSELHADDPWRTLSTELRRYLLLRFARYHVLNSAEAEKQIRQVALLRASSRPWTLTLAMARERQAGLILHVGSARGTDEEIWMYMPACRYVRSNVDHEVQRTGLAAFFEYCLYAADGPRAGSAVVVVDFADLGIKNVDLVAVKNGIRIFLDQYPEAFKRIVFVNYPKWMYGTWKCIAPLLDARTVAKIAWLKTFDEVRTEMCKYFNEKDLPRWLGGMAPQDTVSLENGDELMAENVHKSLNGQAGELSKT